MRKAQVNRKSKETDIAVILNIDGTGETKIKTGISFLDHMLELFAFWGHFDLEIFTLKSDLKVDKHHTNEDLGIVLGLSFKKALGDKVGIQRIGFASVPMEKVVASVNVDISGRGSFVLNSDPRQDGFSKLVDGSSEQKDKYDLTYAIHFFEAFAKNLGMNLNIKIEPVDPDLHTNLEPAFKALGKALDQATQIDPRRKGVPSTKGIID
ncbi:MAG: imidazoleglycerol-phosphate dehydratase [Candidatus Omnitrophota bacterium]